MIEQLINYVNTQEFQMGLLAGLVVMFILFLLSKPKKKPGLDALLEKVLLINQNIQNSQKENIEAHKKLDEIYKTIKGAKER